jgi:chromosome segregation ATPase
MDRQEIHGDVTGAQFSSCNVYIYGDATGCQLNNCYVERYDGKTPKVETVHVFDEYKEKQLEKYKEGYEYYKKEVNRLKNRDDKLSSEIYQLKSKASQVFPLQMKIRELVEHIHNLKLNKQALFESRISDLESKIDALLEVNHSQARRIRELERSHDNNFDENWEFYPSKKMVKKLSEIFTTWLDCEDL